jgi:hypothetical protein
MREVFSGKGSSAEKAHQRKRLTSGKGSSAEKAHQQKMLFARGFAWVRMTFF